MSKIVKQKFKNITSYFKALPKRKKLSLVIILIMAAAIPFTTLLVLRQTNLENEAAAPELKTRAKNVSVPDAYAIKLAKRNSDRKPLIGRDKAAKDNFLRNLKASQHPEEGIVFKSNNVAITYVYLLDSFESEILTTNIDLAKAEAEDWLQGQGLSKQGICDFPLNFFLSASVVDQLPQGTTFDPNPKFCQ